MPRVESYRPGSLPVALCSTAATPRCSTQRGEPGAEEEERGRCGHVRPVRSHLEDVCLKKADGLKGPILDEIRKVGCSGRQSDGSGIGRKLHIDDRTVGNVGNQQAVAERSSKHVFKEVTVERGARRAREECRQREMEEFTCRVRENHRSWKRKRRRAKQADAGSIREVIDSHQS